MALEERFTYQVVPKKPIRNIVKGKIITRPTVLSLSKSEVLSCLKFGNVYRKFYLEPSTNMEKVTPTNLDRLHRSNHISETDYNNNLSDEDNKTVSGLTYTESSGTVNPESDQHDDVVDEEDIVEETENQSETVEEKKAEEEQLSTDDLISTDTEDIDVSEQHVANNNSHSNRSKKKNRNKNRQNSPEISSVPKTAE